MAEWSALQTGKRGVSGSIPAEGKTFFRGIKILEQYINCRFEFNLNLKLNKNLFDLIDSKKRKGPSRSNWYRRRASENHARTASACGPSSTSPQRWIATFHAKRPDWTSAGETSYISSARMILTGNLPILPASARILNMNY